MRQVLNYIMDRRIIYPFLTCIDIAVGVELSESESIASKVTAYPHMKSSTSKSRMMHYVDFLFILPASNFFHQWNRIANNVIEFKCFEKRNWSWKNAKRIFDHYHINIRAKNDWYKIGLKNASKIPSIISALQVICTFWLQTLTPCCSFKSTWSSMHDESSAIGKTRLEVASDEITFDAVSVVLSGVVCCRLCVSSLFFFGITSPQAFLECNFILAKHKSPSCWTNATWLHSQLGLLVQREVTKTSRKWVAGGNSVVLNFLYI